MESIKLIFSDIWNLVKIFGNKKLTDDEWQILINRTEELRKRHINDREMDLLYRDMFLAVQRYYEGKIKKINQTERSGAVATVTDISGS